MSVMYVLARRKIAVATAPGRGAMPADAMEAVTWRVVVPSGRDWPCRSRSDRCLVGRFHNLTRHRLVCGQGRSRGMERRALLLRLTTPFSAQHHGREQDGNLVPSNLHFPCREIVVILHDGERPLRVDYCSHPPRSGPGPVAIERLSGRRPQPMNSPASLMSRSMTTTFTIGHSSHDWPTFQQLLNRADIGVVIDVRSNPASRLSHFNRSVLKDRLNAAGVGYVFLGGELGRRPRIGVVVQPDLCEMQG